MLSYRHAFHAANHADVLKHLTLIACLDYLGRKPVPYLYVDTHAGAGAYELDVGYAALNAEWAGGWQRLTAEVDAPLAVATPDLVKRYISLVDSFRQAVGDEAAYPGSPLLAASCLTPGSRAVFCELHPADHAGATGKQVLEFEVRHFPGFQPQCRATSDPHQLPRLLP